MNPFRFESMKARLTAVTLLVVGIVWIVAAVFTWFEARHEAEEVFDAHLVQAASLLIAQTALEIEDEEELQDTHAPTLHRYARNAAFQVWIEGRLQVHSQNAPQVPLSDVVEGFSDRTIAGEGWRVFSGFNPKRAALVQVGERHSARHALAREIAGGLLKPLLVALPVLALLIWWVVGRAVAPLASTAAELSRRSPTHLDPLPTAGLPAEARPLVERLNELFGRVAQSIEHERRFTADAAHELRTPLAGLRAQAQVAAGAGGLRGAGPENDAARQKALAAVIEGCDRMTRLIEQLLMLARVDAAEPSPQPEVDLAQIVQQVLADIAAGAIEHQVEVEMASPEHVAVRGHAPWLGILVRNLVDNAVRYSPPGGHVRVYVDSKGGPATIEVSDDGPGVPADELSRLGERFHRVLGELPVGVADGSGLGLSICRRIAALHAGRIEFLAGDGGRGLRVRVTLGA